MVGCGGGSGTEVGRDGVDVVGSIVEGHGARSALSLKRFQQRKLCRGVFVSDSNCAVATRGEGVSRGGIEAIRVYTLADGNSAEHFSRVAVDESHELVVAADDEHFVAGVDGEARRRFTGGEGPGIFDFEGLRVKLDEGTLVFEIDENLAFSIGGAEFRFAPEGDGGDEFARRGVNGRGAGGVTVKGEGALGEGIVDDAIGVVVGFGIAEGFERGKIEHGGIGSAAVCGETLIEFVGQSDAVDALCVWNVADDFALVGIDDDNVGAARDEETMRGGIDFEIVPSASTTELYFLNEMVAR